MVNAVEKLKVEQSTEDTECRDSSKCPCLREIPE